MSSGDQPGARRPPTDEEVQAAYEAQVKQIRVEHVLLEDVVTLINLGMRRTGLAEGTADERDLDQVRLAIEAVRAVLPLLEAAAPAQVRQIRDALSQLQLAYVRIGGQPGAAGDQAGQPSPEGQPGPAPAAGAQTSPAEAPSGGAAPKPGEAGPAQRSGKLWVPGQ